MPLLFWLICAVIGLLIVAAWWGTDVILRWRDARRDFAAGIVPVEVEFAATIAGARQFSEGARTGRHSSSEVAEPTPWHRPAHSGDTQAWPVIDPAGAVADIFADHGIPVWAASR